MVEYCAHRAISLLLFFCFSFHVLFCLLSLSLTHTPCPVCADFGACLRRKTALAIRCHPNLTNPENITAFGGVSIGPKEDKLGIRASSTCPVTFSGCEVPAANVLGEVSFFFCCPVSAWVVYIIALPPSLLLLFLLQAMYIQTKYLKYCEPGRIWFFLNYSEASQMC